MRRPRTILPSPLAVLGAKFVYERQNQGFYGHFRLVFKLTVDQLAYHFCYPKESLRIRGRRNLRTGRIVLSTLSKIALHSFSDFTSMRS